MSGPSIGLRELTAEFRRIVVPGRTIEQVKRLADAQGVWFLCPKCWRANGGPVGTHGVLCWFQGRGVPAGEAPGPGRWNARGTSLDDLTLEAGSSSILLRGGCAWHGFVRDGRAIG